MNLGDGYLDYVLEALFGGVMPTAIPDLWLTLYTAAPTSAGGGTEVTTVGTAFARLALTNDTTNFPTPSGGTSANGPAFTWATATADYGTVVAYAFHDDPTADSIVVWGDVTPQFVASGQTPEFLSGVLTTTSA